MNFIRIEAPHFVAGAVIENGRVTTAAPIIRYMQGQSIEWVMGYCLKKGWKFTLTT
jgi:hypothetical protein